MVGSFWVLPVSLVIAGDQSVTPAELVAASPPSDPVATTSEPWLLFTTTLVAFLLSAVVLFKRLWVLPEGTGPIWSGRAEFLLGAWIAMLLSTLLGAGLGIQVANPTTELSTQAAGMLGSYLMQSIILFIILIDQQRVRGSESLFVRPMSYRQVGFWSVAGFIVAFPVSQSMGMFAGYVQSLFSSEEQPVLAHDTLVSISRDPLNLWAIVISVLVVLVTPCLEEFAYRGLLQQGFRKMGAGRPSAILLTSLLFVFMHVPNIDGGLMATPVVALLTLSLILGWLYERTGRLLAPILVHGAFNASNLFLMSLTL